MSSILLIGTIESIFLALLLAGKKKKSAPDFYLGIILILLAFSIGLTFLEIRNISNNFQNSWMLNISWLILFLQGPALWFYIRSFSSSSKKLKPLHLIHLLPFLLFASYHFIDFIALPAEQKIYLVREGIFKTSTFYKISVLSVAISTLSYFLLALHQIREHRLHIMNHFSKIDDKDLSWLRALVIASICCYGVNFGLFILDLIFEIGTYQMLMAFAYSFGTVYVFFLGYFGITQGTAFSNIKSVSTERVTSNSFIIKSEEHGSNELLIQRIFSIMEEEKPWLDPEITLTKLSDYTNLKPQELSALLNEQLNQNFFDFVNKYRVREFKNQVLGGKNSHLSIIGIAYNCGFNSKASFYRSFKKFEGTSPTEYITRVS